jgi:hypothetical protein
MPKSKDNKVNMNINKFYIDIILTIIYKIFE